MHTFGDIDICNHALGYLQKAQIASFAENSEEAAYSKRYYAQSVSTLLALLDWGFARRWVTGTVPVNISIKRGWTTAVLWPNDCLRVRGIAKVFGTEPTPYFEVGRSESSTASPQRVIYTSISAPVLVYTADVEDTALFSPLFVEALGWMLASKMAIPLAKGREFMGDIRKAYQQAMADAAAAELNEGLRMPEAFDPVNEEVSWQAAR